MNDETPATRAGEYVLGTLSSAERDQFERELTRDAALRAEVRSWERRFAPLAASVEPEEPPAALWAAIERSLDDNDRPLRTGVDVVQRLRRSLGLWRGVALGMGGLATALAAALILVTVFRAPTVTPAAGDYLAVVDRGGEVPALIVHVDLDRASVRIRSLNTEPATNRSLELWYVGNGRTPLSLGVISQASELRALPASLHGSSLEGSRIAVSTEPKGGSPTGSPTGPVVYSGKLIRAEP